MARLEKNEKLFVNYSLMESLTKLKKIVEPANLATITLAVANRFVGTFPIS